MKVWLNSMNKIKKIYEKELNIICDSEEKTVMAFDNNSSNGEMTFYHIMPGIDLIYNKFNMIECIKPYYDEYAMNIIEINYCKSGRFGSVIGDDNQVYLGDGEMEANIVGIKRNNSEFPLGFYNGIEIMIDTNIAIEYLTPMFPQIAKQIEDLKEYLMKNKLAVLIKRIPSLIHIFNELYDMNDLKYITYMKLKVLEILIMMQIIPFDKNIKENQYFNKMDRQKVKQIHNEIISNLDKKLTLDELSKKYDISLTNLKNCFKEIYGKPYYTYL